MQQLAHLPGLKRTGRPGAIWRRRGALLLACIALATTAAAQDDSAENAVKAAFIFNFVKFIEWPADAFSHDDDALTICIWGTDTLKGALAPLEGKSAHRREIQIRHLARKTSVTGCHIVYVSRDEAGRLKQALRQVGGKHVLTVGDAPQFAAYGGVINMFKTEDQIRFEINLDAARASGLSISSRLLGLARVIEGTD